MTYHVHCLSRHLLCIRSHQQSARINSTSATKKPLQISSQKAERSIFYLMMAVKRVYIQTPLPEHQSIYRQHNFSSPSITPRHSYRHQLTYHPRYTFSPMAARFRVSATGKKMRPIEYRGGLILTAPNSYFTRKQANQLELTGWVRNLPNNKVRRMWYSSPKILTILTA